jgi:hypothetical protein
MTMHNVNRCGSLVALALASLALAACGGSSPHSASSTAKTSSGGASSGPIRATLVGQNHHPVANKKWIYTVTAKDAHGHPLSGTVETEFAFQGAVVGRESPPTHRLKNGRFKDNLEFPARSVGYPVDLQVVVHTRLGSVTLRWPVKVQR